MDYSVTKKRKAGRDPARMFENHFARIKVCGVRELSQSEWFSAVSAGSGVQRSCAKQRDETVAVSPVLSTRRMQEDIVVVFSEMMTSLPEHCRWQTENN
jgi:hypothetical protein